MNKRYALCVGNNYPGTSAQLSGCVNDAFDWTELLRANGYEVMVLLEARKSHVLDHLRLMVNQARFGDRIVFTYSGHGTWIPDRDGDEVDHRDEALVMADYMEGGLLTDDELHAVFRGTRYGVGSLVLSDSCHSGTVSRFVPSVSTGMDTHPKAKFLSPTEFTSLNAGTVRLLEQMPASEARYTTSLISGCGDFEYSYDAWFKGRANGAFTRAAIDSYKPGITLRGWHAAIRTQLPSDSYPQSPELTATPYRKYTRAI